MLLFWVVAFKVNLGKLLYLARGRQIQVLFAKTGDDVSQRSSEKEEKKKPKNLIVS